VFRRWLSRDASNTFQSATCCSGARGRTGSANATGGAALTEPRLGSLSVLLPSLRGRDRVRC
jgi:hypothetical protein